MKVLLCLAAISCWAAVQLQPGTLLPPLSWPILSACTWLALLHLRPRLDDSDKRLVLSGLLASVMMLVFLMEDGEFKGWGDVYYFCGSRMQYCTCSYRWNIAGWNKAVVLWGFVLLTALGVQRLLVQLVLQGLLPGEEVVTRESFISIGWRLIPYWLNRWEQQWGAECSSMMFELPQFAVELVIILPCIQILCSRMKVLAMPSVNAAMPRGWDAASPEQVEEAFVPNVQRGCWERRPEQRQLWHRVKANRQVTSFVALLCLLACFNSLYVPLHLEDAVLAHPRTAAMQVGGRLPKAWRQPSDLHVYSDQLQLGTLNLTHSFVTQQALKHAMHGRRAGLWRLGSTDIDLADPPTDSWRDVTTGTTNPLVLAHGHGGNFAAWVSAVEQGPWQHNRTWTLAAVDDLHASFVAYGKECSEGRRFQGNVHKHHYEVFRMQDPNHRLSIPLIEAALALMRLSTEKFFVLLSLYVAFLLFRIPPSAVATLISVNARISNAFARLVLYSFPCVCWVYGAGVVFSALVTAVFWGGPLWQIYHGLRTHACTVTVRGLRPATAAEIERMHHDCSICWCPMTVPGGSQQANSPAAQPRSSDGAHAHAAADDGHSRSTAGAGTAAGHAQATGAIGAVPAAAAGAAGPARAATIPDRPAVPTVDTDGSTLPCGHCYHQSCLTQWLQQCHGQGSAPTCPMCQSRMLLAVKWHLWKALFSPTVWQLPARRRAHQVDEVGDGEAPAPVDEVAAAAVAVQHNNYLLRHNPHLAVLLAELPQFLAPENMQLLADVQELRRQRRQLAQELQFRQQQLQELEGRHAQLEHRLELQRQQLLNDLTVLEQQLARQQQQQQQQHPAADPQPDQQEPQQPVRQQVLQLVQRLQQQHQQLRHLQQQQQIPEQEQQNPLQPPQHQELRHHTGQQQTPEQGQQGEVQEQKPGRQQQQQQSAMTNDVGGKSHFVDGCSSMPSSSRVSEGNVMNRRAAAAAAAGCSSETHAGQPEQGALLHLPGQQQQQQQQQRRQGHPLLRWRWRLGRRA